MLQDSLKFEFSLAIWNGGKIRFLVSPFFGDSIQHEWKMFKFTDTVSSFPYGWMVLNLIWLELTDMDAFPLILIWFARPG